MNSIHSKLTLRLTVSLTMLTITACVVLYLYIHGQLVRQFDADLHARTHSLASLLRIKRDGQLAMDYSDKSMPEYLPGQHAEYFEALLPGGAVMERSLSLGGQDLVDPHSLVARQRTWNLKLPDGRDGRAMLLMAVPFLDSEDRDEKSNAGQTAQSLQPEKMPRVMFIAARSRNDIDHISNVLIWALSIVTASLAMACVLAVRLTVGHGLKPVDRVASQAALIGPQTLDFRFEVSSLPSELRPICLRLNDLLARLDDAFQRERRVTADMSHELRTPIAELRSLTDVARLWPNDTARTSIYLRDAHEIALRMESLVGGLLALARSQSSRSQVTIAAIELRPFIENRLSQLQKEITRRELRVTVDVPRAQIVFTDIAIFTRIIDNLISNAVHYAPPGGAIDFLFQVLDAKSCMLCISNDCEGLAAADLPKLFDPFWRKDSVRSSGSKLGLGLTLVKEYAQQLGVELAVNLPSADRFEISLRIPGDASTHEALAGDPVRATV